MAPKQVYGPDIVDAIAKKRLPGTAIFGCMEKPKRLAKLRVEIAEAQARSDPG